jgi:hypothetical protein
MSHRHVGLPLAVRASETMNAVMIGHNHVRQKLTRPGRGGGRASGEDEAGSLARRHVEETFCRGGAWRIVALDIAAFKNTMTSRTDKLSPKGAWDFAAYQAAGSAKKELGPFVTRGARFAEGVHPAPRGERIGVAVTVERSNGRTVGTCARRAERAVCGPTCSS